MSIAPIRGLNMRGFQPARRALPAPVPSILPMIATHVAWWWGSMTPSTRRWWRKTGFVESSTRTLFFRVQSVEKENQRVGYWDTTTRKIPGIR